MTLEILVPTRGSKLALIKLGTENARQYLESQTDKQMLEEARLLASLKELQRVLTLSKLPGRIEAYDISNIQGTNPVGSMVMFDFGRPKKSDYRKFKINKKQTPDDFAMMAEMLERRFKHSTHYSLPTTHSSWPLPDLILIDGGKGQLHAAIKAIRNAELDSASNNKRSRNKFGIATIPVIGLAKRLEEIFMPGKPKSLILNPNSIALFLLQRIRDEAHRFAIKYHRQLRSRQSLTSVLDGLSGIGPAKKKRLLIQFGSAQKIRASSLTELAAIVGSSTAEKIKASL